MQRRTAALLGTAAVALLLGLASTAAVTNAAPGDVAQRVAERLARRPHPDTVAIAIGQLNEDDGGTSWLSLRAGSRGDAARGNLRFYCREAGYYNGAVRVLSVSDGGDIHAEGGGGLFRPDGTRTHVRFSLDVSADGTRTSLEVAGEDVEYSMSGSLAGFVFAGPPPQPHAVTDE